MGADREGEEDQSKAADGASRDRRKVLAINVGSSSLKFALFELDHPDPEPRKLLSGRVERIGQANPSRIVNRPDGPDEKQAVAGSDHETAARDLIAWLEGEGELDGIAAVGHRIVHGGPRFSQPERITPEVLTELERITPLDPDHLPQELAVVRSFQQKMPGSIPFALFDTAFHHDMPRVAQLLPLPRKYEAMGVRRYGFHGLSYGFLIGELARVAGEQESRGRVILTHLGSGASLAAVRDGHCLDTTMGFTPAAGLVMATRTGDIDPGLVRFLMRTEGLNPDQFDRMVNHDSGLLGISETSADIRDLLAHDEDIRAREAVDLFCQQAKKGIGAYAAVLGGLDTLVFAGGIGEHSAEVRRRICSGLDFLGITLDDASNRANAPLISSDTARTRVRVIATDEEIMIARAAARFLA